MAKRLWVTQAMRALTSGRKNSWGTSWVKHGYVKLRRGKHPRAGECDILSGPLSFPVQSGMLSHRAVV